MPENPKNPSEMEIAESELQTELEKWATLGITPEGWMPQGGVLALMIRIDVMTEILEEAGLFDMDNADLKTKQHYKERLEGIREEIEPRIREERLEAFRRRGGILQ